MARQAAPVIGLVPGVGTALGAAIGGLGSVMEGRNMKGHLSAGLQGALSGMANTKLLGGQGYKGVMGAARGGLGKLGLGGAKAAGSGTTLASGSLGVTTAAAGNTGTSLIPSVVGAAPGGVVAAGANAAAGTGALSTAAAPAGWAGRLAGFAARHPNAVAGALGAAGSMMGGGGERDMMDARTEGMELDNAESAYDLERKKRRDEQFAQIFAGAGIQTPGFRGVAPNPYAQVGG